MVATVVFAAAAANMVGKGFFGFDVDITRKYFVFKALGAGVAAPHTFVGLQGVVVHGGVE